MATLPEIVELDAFRLSKDCSFEDLAQMSKKAKCFIPMRTLHYLLMHRPDVTSLRDRTIYKVRALAAATRLLEAKIGRSRKGSKAA